MDDWDIDVCYSASQKCLGAPPGLAPISFGERAMDAINKRVHHLLRVFTSTYREWQSTGTRRSAFTTTPVPITMTYAMRESLRMMMEEGIEARHDQARPGSPPVLQGGPLTAMGLDLATDRRATSSIQSRSSTSPEGVDEAGGS